MGSRTSRSMGTAIRALPYLLAIILVVGLAAIVLSEAPRATEHLAFLQQEFDAIPRPPNSHFENRYVHRIPTDVSISDEYSSSLTADALRSYYSGELVRRGWHPCGERVSADGEEIVYAYKRLTYSADLDLPNLDPPGRFTISFSWGWPEHSIC